MYRVGVKQNINVGHFLVGDFAEETKPHRHDYVVEWACGTQKLDANGFSVDIAFMELSLADLAKHLDNRLLNDIDFFSDIQASLENFARYAHTWLVKAASGANFPEEIFMQSQVTVWESPTAWASFAP